MEENPNIEHIENFLLMFQGGEITLLENYWNEGIALLRINHVEKKNAISGKMMVDLRNCILQLEKWESGKAIILYGEGQNFCSGGDLDFARKANNPTAGFYMSYFMQDILKRFRKLPFVTVSLVHGPVLGGGAELSVFSDFILAADNVKFGFVHGNMGIITAWGGTSRLLQMLGERKALEILLTSKIYNAQECLDLGVAFKIVEEGNKLEETVDFVKTLTVHHSSIVQSYKMITGTDNFEENLVKERNEFYLKWGSKLNREALDKRIKHVKI